MPRLTALKTAVCKVLACRAKKTAAAKISLGWTTGAKWRLDVSPERRIYR
jgi:hypothetical protein